MFPSNKTTVSAVPICKMLASHPAILRHGTNRKTSESALQSYRISDFSWCGRKKSSDDEAAGRNHEEAFHIAPVPVLFLPNRKAWGLYLPAQAKCFLRSMKALPYD